MEPVLLFTVLLVGAAAGILGALFGLGGGIVIIPILTAVYGLPIVDAAAVSLVGIVATSVGGTVYYLEKGVTNIRLGLFLEISTVVGSVIGAFLALIMQEWIIMVIYAGVVLLGAAKMIANPHFDAEENENGEFSYTDLKTGKRIGYDVKHKKSGSAICVVAGMISSLTGVGGGVVKVPAMNILMNVPMKAATATSSYMIGITAFSGSMIFLVNGVLQLDVAGFVAIGTFLGAIVGSRLSKRFDSGSMKKYFSVLMILVAAVMLLQAGGIL